MQKATNYKDINNFFGKNPGAWCGATVTALGNNLNPFSYHKQSGIGGIFAGRFFVSLCKVSITH